MDLNEFITGMAVLIVGGILGGIGTYFIKPPLDAWLERRKKIREARQAARQKAEEVAEQRQQADRYALDYRDKLVHELRNLRILDMVQPLDLERTYVRLSIQEEQPRRYAEAEEMSTLAQGDPNLLFELAQDKLAEDKVESLLPEEALRRYRHMVVLGDPGAGKTTMLKYLCLMSAQNRLSALPDLPLLVVLNRYAKTSETGLFDFIVTDLAERYGFQEVGPYLQGRMDQGSVLLLLDGLDEVTVGSLDEAEAVYRRTVNEINQLTIRYPKCPIVVTSRRAGWKGLVASNFMIMAVLDFSWEDIQCFIDNWFGVGSDRSRDLQNRLSRQIRMQALAANPLLLSLIAIVFEQDLELPERRAKLYERCVHVLLTEWDAHRGIKRASHFTVDRKRDLLEEVALHFHCQGLRYFPKDDLLSVIASYLPTVNIPADQAELVLAEISAQHALLKEQATDWYGFLHLTLQEYFTAVRLDRGNELELALTRMHNPWWEEVLLLLAGMIKDATSLLDTILSDRDDIFFNNLLLAGRCLAGTPRISRIDLRKQIICNLKTLIEDERVHWLPRSQAVKTLSEAEGEKSSSYLLNLIDNQNISWQVRTAGVDAFGTTTNRAVVNKLLGLLPNKSVDLNIQERIADSLVHLCDRSTTPRLLAFLTDENIDSQIRGRIARSLGLIGDKTAIPNLRALLLDESLDKDMAWYVGRALGYLRFTADPKELMELLKDQRINLIARWALSKAVDILDRSAAFEVVKWLSDESIEKSVRWSFANRLGRFGKMVQPKFSELYSDERLDLSIRASLAISLLDLGETKLVSGLKQLMLNPNVNYYVRKKIAEALILAGDKDIAEHLMSLLEEDGLEMHVRLRATNLLGSLGDSGIAPQLLDFIRNENTDPHLRARAASALCALKLNGLTTQVREFVLDETANPLVQGKAVHCFGQVKNGVAWLIELLDHESIGEEVYLALYSAARQSGESVFAKSEGSYEIRPIQ